MENNKSVQFLELSSSQRQSSLEVKEELQQGNPNPSKFKQQSNQQEQELFKPIISDYIQPPVNVLEQTKKKKRDIPIIPQRLYVMSFVLVITGLMLILLGIWYQRESNIDQNAIILWIFGSMLLFPGVYYSIHTWKASRDRNIQEIYILRQPYDMNGKVRNSF